ncbi:MAG: hypothetical protein D6732_15860 [Methanobacteriota archaeon]|nr:MAG: hypothetical protein D6732_15860 [Euryarchaeota archaeon]
MARKGQRSITIYVPEAKYDEIKKASEGLNMTMKDYLLHLHDTASGSHSGVSLEEKFDLILEKLDRLEKQGLQVSVLNASSSGRPQSTKSIYEEVDGLEKEDWTRLEAAFGYTRTEKQRLAIAKIYSLLKQRYPYGISVQDARLLTNSSAKTNLERMVQWGLAKREGNRFFLLIPQ